MQPSLQNNAISTIIVIKHEQENLILRALESVKDISAEIIIADIGMSEQLQAIVDKFPGVQRITLHEHVPYVELIRERLKEYASAPWILFLDPDEALSQTLREKILTTLNRQEYITYISTPRLNTIFGNDMYHSRWWPDYQTRIFKKDSVSFPTTIHSQPQTSGMGVILEPQTEFAILHENYSTVDQLAEKTLRYAKAEALERTKISNNFTLLEALTKGTSEFVSRFFAGEGYKDGINGFVMAWNQMLYYHWVYLYYWEAKKFQSQEDIKNTTSSFMEHFTKEIHYWLVQTHIIKGFKKVRTKIKNMF